MKARRRLLTDDGCCFRVFRVGSKYVLRRTWKSCKLESKELKLLTKLLKLTTIPKGEIVII